jgi:hypothetical protein
MVDLSCHRRNLVTDRCSAGLDPELKIENPPRIKRGGSA